MLLRRRSLLKGLVGLPLVSRGARAASATRVFLAPLSPAPNTGDTTAAVEAIRALFGAEVTVLEAEPLPHSAWYAPRKRYRAEKLLEHLAERLASAPGADAASRIVGFTSHDISTTKGDILDWGVMGLGDIGGPACVVSRHRCAKTAKSAAEARVRLAKVVVHELGHTFGSEHCPTPACLMNDAQGTVKAVDAERQFCERTRALFRARGAPVVEFPKLPW